MKHQQESMQMIVAASKAMYGILEKVAEREIDNDPIGFIREESFIKNQGKQLLTRP
jgi:hypothetical protein